MLSHTQTHTHTDFIELTMAELIVRTAVSVLGRLSCPALDHTDVIWRLKNRDADITQLYKDEHYHAGKVFFSFMKNK